MIFVPGNKFRLDYPYKGPDKLISSLFRQGEEYEIYNILPTQDKVIYSIKNIKKKIVFTIAFPSFEEGDKVFKVLELLKKN